MTLACSYKRFIAHRAPGVASVSVFFCALEVPETGCSGLCHISEACHDCNYVYSKASLQVEQAVISKPDLVLNLYSNKIKNTFFTFACRLLDSQCTFLKCILFKLYSILLKLKLLILSYNKFMIK